MHTKIDKEMHKTKIHHNQLCFWNNIHFILTRYILYIGLLSLLKGKEIILIPSLPLPLSVCIKVSIFTCSWISKWPNNFSALSHLISIYLFMLLNEYFISPNCSFRMLKQSYLLSLTLSFTRLLTTYSYFYTYS